VNPRVDHQDQRPPKVFFMEPSHQDKSNLAVTLSQMVFAILGDNFLARDKRIYELYGSIHQRVQENYTGLLPQYKTFPHCDETY
jgi:hypothetical protein